MNKFFWIFFLLFTPSALLFSQQKTTEKLDRIIKRDYTIIDAAITKMSSTAIEYKLPNESLINVLDVKEIARINFANGKSQTFNLSEQSITPSSNSTSPEGSNNNVTITKLPIKQHTIAILPVPFVNTETQYSSEEMSKLAQTDLFNSFAAKELNIAPLSVQDLRTTNSLLKKAGINYSNIDETPTEELHQILGVDHLVAVKASYFIERKNSTTKQEVGKVDVKDNKIRTDDFSATFTNEIREYRYTMYFDIFKNNEKIYSQTRKPFFDQQDSWLDAMNYMLKRCPIYNKK
jgi:hypothetical protein